MLETLLESENEYLSSQIRLYVETGNKQFNDKYEKALEANLFGKVEKELSKLNVPTTITSQLTTIQEKSNELADIVCFAIKKCRELQRKIQNVATRYFPYFLDNAFVKRKLWPVYEIIWAW